MTQHTWEHVHLSAVVTPLPIQTDFKQHYGDIIKWVSPQGLCLFTCRAAKTTKLTLEKKNPA